MNKSIPGADYWIKKLHLEPHPEGGYFREVYRSEEQIQDLPPRYEGSRSFSTSIYFLLKGGECSVFHRLLSDEAWHFYEGSPLELYMLDHRGDLEKVTLGRNAGRGEHLQFLVKNGIWFAARPQDPLTYSLMGCTVAPGFDFRDFEMDDRDSLIRRYPVHRDLISEFTLPSG